MLFFIRLSYFALHGLRLMGDSGKPATDLIAKPLEQRDILGEQDHPECQEKPALQYGQHQPGNAQDN